MTVTSSENWLDCKVSGVMFCPSQEYTLTDDCRCLGVGGAAICISLLNILL